MQRLIGRLLPWRLAREDCSGATAIEYGMIAGGISIVIVIAVGLVGGSLTEMFSSVAEAVGAEVFPDPCDQGGTNCGN